MRVIRSVLAVAGMAAVLASSAGAGPAAAHHSFGFYDMQKTANIEGTVQKFEWSNPHCWLFVTVPSATGGAEVTYGFELQSVGEMMRRGWKKTSVKPGDKLKVAFRPLRDGRPAGLMLNATGSDGKVIGRPDGPPPV